jgi:glycerol-1-phosphate dehydrogenase [NAD(P)+]
VRTAHRIRKERYTILGEVDLSREASQNALYITGIL